MQALTRLGAMVLVAVAGLLGLGVTVSPAGASPMDANTCLATAERVDAGQTLTPEEQDAAHKACISAFTATASIFQKYQFEEADFAITGKRHQF